MSAKAQGPATPAEQPNDDAWKHRHARMRCGSCMWYVMKGDALAGFGRCRRHAPTMGGYPAVFDADWCGDHKLDEGKLDGR